MGARSVKHLGLTILLIAFSSNAVAHVGVVEEDTHPAAGSELLQAPPRIVIGFNGNLEPGLSRFAVVSEAEETVATGRVSPTDKTRLVATLPNVEPGTYVVHWTAVGMDAHRITGHYSFVILPKQ